MDDNQKRDQNNNNKNKKNFNGLCFGPEERQAAPGEYRKQNFPGLPTGGPGKFILRILRKICLGFSAENNLELFFSQG